MIGLLFLFTMRFALASIQTGLSCPQGINLLDESYPAKAIVLSDVASKGYQSDKLDMLKRLMPELLQNTDLKIVLVAKQKNFESLTKNLTHGERKRVVRLRQVPLTNWMQDPWVAQFDAKDGATVLRPLQKYNGNTFDSGKLAGAVKLALGTEMSVRIGADLESPHRSEALSGQYGGNFLAMGSLCIVGSSNLKEQFQNISASVCGGEGTVMKVPTSFLNVGHADEVVKALPLLQKAEHQCSMVLAVGSPRRAKKILEEHPQELFFDFRDNNQKSLDKKAALLQLKDRRHYRMLCLRMMGIHRQNNAARWVDDAFPVDDEKENADLSPCLDFKNKDFLKVLRERTDYDKALNHVQEKMDEFVKALVAQYKKQNSNCDLKVVELPQLFGGRIRQTLKHGFKPRMEGAQSLFPNPSNGEVLGDKYIMPDPVNATFRADLEQSIEGLGLHTVFLNTHFAHRLQGNFHCMEKTLRTCGVVSSASK